ncbi:MAG: TRAP transporter large permease subunit [Myxococcales bacterium]|nr:TRAP transporter large permease subunit [Myxococcales bacterium]
MTELVTAHPGLASLVVVALALIGAPIFACMTVIAAIGLSTLDFAPPAFLVDEFGLFVAMLGNGLTKVQALATGSSAAALATLPLFTFSGYVMAEAKTAQRLVNFASAMVGWIPGGIAIVTIFACAIFTTFTGASGVTIVAIGGLIMPSLLKEGYKDRFALGLVTGTGSIGLLFPPSLPLIVYGIVYGLAAQGAQDTGGAELQVVKFDMERFLFAGIVPGLLLVAVIGVYAVWVALRDGVPRTKFNARVALAATLEALPELLIPLIIIITLATGALQIPEAAALTAAYVLIVEGVYYGDIKLKALPRISREAMTMVGAIFIVIVAATLLTDFFINARVPDQLYTWMDHYIGPIEIFGVTIGEKWVFLFFLNILLLIVGCLMDIFSAIVVVVPLIVPAALQYNIDPYHLGVIFLLNLEIGYLTPPVGLNLFISSIRFKKPMSEVVSASLPFLLAMLVALALVTYVPALTPIRATADVEPPSKAQPGALVADAGAGPPIVWPDGGVWTLDRCEQPAIKEDALGYAECQAMFSLWDRCAKLGEELERLECQSKVLEGGDPFELDAGPAADAGPAGDAAR